MKKLFQLMAFAIAAVAFTACSTDDNPSSGNGIAKDIVGKWYSDVSGLTFACWNYGKTMQMTEFKADGTGSTSFYYLIEDKPIGLEQITFTYSISDDGTVTGAITDRPEIDNLKWNAKSDELQLTIDNGAAINFKKMDAEMASKFEEWSKADIPINVPKPAKFTVFVYGNATPDMDDIIEYGFWDRAKEILTDHDNVRVVCMYKYSEETIDDEGNSNFAGHYADPGDIIWFELTDKTDLTKLREEGLQVLGLSKEAQELKICTPETLRAFLEFSSLFCPAQEYVFTFWGHGSGFVPMNDIPGKYGDDVAAPTRGLIGDNWNHDEQMDMYEFKAGLMNSGLKHLNTLYFHNCLMGNLETLAEVKDCADYICCSSHILNSDGLILTEFVRGLIEKGESKAAFAQMFDRAQQAWESAYSKETANGDYKMIETSRFDDILKASKHLADRLVALYPTQKDAINKASEKVYRFFDPNPGTVTWDATFYDISNYAHLLAAETGDAEFAQIANELDQAFASTFVYFRDVNNSVDHLDHYTLSVCLVSDKLYTNTAFTTVPDFLANFNEGYEQCYFHKYTGWGNFLKINECKMLNNPASGGGGPAE